MLELDSDYGLGRVVDSPCPLAEALQSAGFGVGSCQLDTVRRYLVDIR